MVGIRQASLEQKIDRPGRWRGGHDAENCGEELLPGFRLPWLLSTVKGPGRRKRFFVGCIHGGGKDEDAQTGFSLRSVDTARAAPNEARGCP